MLYLKTFGGLSVHVDGAPGAGAGQRRKTLALLALLAAHGSHGLSRDKIIAFLWPESDSVHARGCLKQLCYALRHDLSCHELFLGVNALRLNTAAINSDLEEFTAAVQNGDLTRAAGLYVGPFLDGFFVGGSVEFEQWVEEQRAHLSRRAARVLDTLAESASARGRHQEAMDWWIAHYAVEPFNARVALGVIEELAAVGDRAAALEFADAHQRRLATELNAAPEPALVALTERLRSAPAYAPVLATITVQGGSRPYRRLRQFIVVAALVLLASLRPSVSSHGALTYSARLLGPDGRTSVCQYLPAQAVVTARLVTASPRYRQGGYGAFACPDNELRVSAPAPGNWNARIELPRSPSIGALPVTHIETGIVFERHQDVVIRETSELGGYATFEGKPAKGVGLIVGADTLHGLMMNSGTSDPAGRWRDHLGRSLRLQAGVRYSLNLPCQYLGARMVNMPPEHFLFPTEVGSVNCVLDSAPALRLTHHRTRLVVTPLPGDIGGLSGELVHTWGYGWGVQYPVDSSRAPAHEPSVSQLFVGGLVIGLEPDRLLSGVDLRGEAACTAACRDLGMHATVRVSRTADGAGPLVAWSYSDSGSQEAIGIQIVQESFDGRPPADYVVFHFTLRNAAAATITFHAGFLGDWDVGENGSDDIGSSAMHGRLMYQGNDGGAGPFLGTLLVSAAPRVANYFYRPTSLPTPAEQVQALDGRLSRPTSDRSGDARYIHGTGPFALGPAEVAELWIAIVAGETQQQLFANAASAEADISRRRQTVPLPTGPSSP